MSAGVAGNRAANDRRPTRAEISLEALRANYAEMRRLAGGAEVMAVVKANAYGHGAVECSRALEQQGAKWFGVTCLSEALELRGAGIAGRILLLSGFFPGEEDAVVAEGITPAVWSVEQIQGLERAGAAVGKKVSLHIKVDTGMHRLGAAPESLPEVVRTLRQAKHLEFEGLFSHFASADTDAESVAVQAKQFEAARRVFVEAGLTPKVCHMNNSAAIASSSGSCHQMVRPGIALYGYALPNEAVEQQAKLRPVMSLKTAVMQVRDVAAGEALGYNGTFRTVRASRIAAIPIGYGDGLNRLLSNEGRVLVRGGYAPIVGRVSMDITLVDVTDISGAAVGDEVVVLGEQGGRSIDAWEHARICGTIPYEILCNVSRRVPRVFV